MPQWDPRENVYINLSPRPGLEGEHLMILIKDDPVYALFRTTEVIEVQNICSQLRAPAGTKFFLNYLLCLPNTHPWAHRLDPEGDAPAVGGFWYCGLEEFTLCHNALKNFGHYIQSPPHAVARFTAFCYNPGALAALAMSCATRAAAFGQAGLNVEASAAKALIKAWSATE